MKSQASSVAMMTESDMFVVNSYMLLKVTVFKYILYVLIEINLSLLSEIALAFRRPSKPIQKRVIVIVLRTFFYLQS